MVIQTRKRPKKSRLSQAVSGQQLKQIASSLIEQPIDYIDNAAFRRRNAAKKILAPVEVDPAAKSRSRRKRPSNVPAYFASLYETPLLTAEEEVQLFRKFNFLKFRADKLRSRLKKDKPDADLVQEIEFFLEQAHESWNRLVQANLRLVVSIARRFVDGNHSFDELVSDGQIALMNAIEKFDYSRGFRFSTYATHAIQRGFYRRIKNKQRDLSRVKSTATEIMEEVPDRFDGEDTSAEDFAKIQTLMSWIDDELDDRERHIVAARYGLNADQETLTLRMIGDQLGISKERVRQIQIRAIDKLQDLAGVDRSDEQEA